MQQLQRHSDSQDRAKKIERFSRKQRMIAVAIAALIVTIIIATVQVLSLLSVIPAYWANILSGVATTVGVLFAFLALLPILFPEPAAAPTPTFLPPVQPPYRGLVGLPPPIDSVTIEQRENVVQAAYEMLRQPGTSCVVLTGIAGVGKSTLAALLYRFVEMQHHAGKSIVTLEPLWLRVDASVTLADVTGNLFEVLGKSPPDFTHLSPQSQAMVLFNALNTMGQARLVILDQFENLLDPETGFALPTRPGVGEWLDVLNSQQFKQSGCRILLTSRLWPKGTREYAPVHMREYEIKGLESMEGIDLLQKLGVTAAEADLREAVKRCEGHALSLTLLATLLKRNRSLSLGVVLNNPLYIQFWTGDIARNLLDYTYQQQLDPAQRKLLLAFSVYREAVPLGAVQALIDGNARIPTSQILTALETLLAQHLLQAVGEDRYQLHAIVANYARDHFVDSDDTANMQALQAAHMKAAQYYRHQAQTSAPPREKRRGVSDVHDMIEAVWQLCQAEQWQSAYNLIQREGIFADLRRWGSDVVSLDLYQLLLPLNKWHPEPAQAAYLYSHLGRLYDDLGETEKARSSYAQALNISSEIGDGKREGVALNNLGRLSEALGKTEEARTYFEQALDVCRKVKDRGGEGTTLNNLGQVYTILSRTELARSCLEQALTIFRGDAQYPAGEARALNNLGRLSANLGEKERARDFFEQALSIYEGIGDQRGESHALNNLGNISAELGQSEKARKYLEQALSMSHELGNRRAEALTLNDLGRVCNASGEKQVARDYYKRGLSICREEKDREEEGKTLLNLGILYFEQGQNDSAFACFLLAKSILEEVESREQASVQQWIDDLHGKVGEEGFANLLAQVEPKTEQVVEESLSKKFS
jgi:tetratricopeptide (TPR) repeat protein